MIDFEQEEWNGNPGLRRLLETYEQQHDLAKRQRADFDGWLPRIGALEGIADSELPRLHGTLIALGYLRFQLHDRRTGMQYQLDSSAMTALSRVQVGADDATMAENDERPQAA